MSFINGDPPKPSGFKPLTVPRMKSEGLRRMNLGDWLQKFSITLQASRERRGAIVTPFLEGAITHLNWSAQYIELLQADLHWLARDNKLLRKHIEHIGGVPAPPFRPEAEEAADPTPTPDKPDGDT